MASPCGLTPIWPVEAQMRNNARLQREQTQSRAQCLPAIIKGHDMGYNIHIQRPDSDISLDEWLAAVSKLPCLRPHEGPVEQTTLSGHTISFNSSPGDLDVATPDGWFFAFRFSGEWGTFSGTPEIVESPLHPVHNAAKQLAQLLGAELIGDDGEQHVWTD